jgi:hypothetical protein
MDHQEIGHSDSGDDERCPLCRQMDGNDQLNRENATLRARVAELEEQCLDLEIRPFGSVVEELERRFPGLMVCSRDTGKPVNP